MQYRDHDLTTADDARLTRYRRHHVGFVFQFYNLIPSLTARENVALVTDIVERSDDAGRSAGRWSPSAHRLRSLSVAAVRRRAAARRDRAGDRQAARVLLCDEPTGALDYATGTLVLEVHRAHQPGARDDDRAVITHNAAIASMADRVLYLGDGRIQKIERNARRMTSAELAW